MTPEVTDLVRQVVNSPFNDRLSRSIDWIVIGLMLALLIEYELIHHTKRAAAWKASPRTWMYVVPLAVAAAFVIAQRMKNGR